MAKGKFSAVHKTSDGDVVEEVRNVSESDVSDFLDIISELEGDSGASITVTWED